VENEELKSKKTDRPKLRSIGKQSEKSVELVMKKKREARVGRIKLMSHEHVSLKHRKSLI